MSYKPKTNWSCDADEEDEYAYLFTPDLVDTQVVGLNNVSARLSNNRFDDTPAGVVRITTIMGTIMIQYGKQTTSGWSTDPWICGKFDGYIPRRLSNQIIKVVQMLEYSHDSYGMEQYPKPDLIGLKISHLVNVNTK